LYRITSGRNIQDQVEIAGLRFPGRVGLAAGFDKNAEFYRQFAMFGFAFVEIGTVTPKPQPGNPKPRLFRLKRDNALINRMGFNNKGVDHVVEKLKNRPENLIIGGNIGKNTATLNEAATADYSLCFEKLYEYVDYFVVNVSCPNIQGLEKLQDQDSLREILKAVTTIRSQKTVRKPVFLKISPDLSREHLDESITLCLESGLDGMIATNTTKGRNGLTTDPQKIASLGNGGLSGRPLTHDTAKTVSYICKQSQGRIPVIASGGIMSINDALEVLDAGAVMLQLYTGFIYEGPFIVCKINRAIANRSRHRMK
jgi:dihydroorotate dehydrogenase